MGFNFHIEPEPEKRGVVGTRELATYATLQYTVWKVAEGKNFGSWCEGARFIPVDDNVILVVWEHHENGEKRISVYDPEAFIDSSNGTVFEAAEDSFSMDFKFNKVSI